MCEGRGSARASLSRARAGRRGDASRSPGAQRTGAREARRRKSATRDTNRPTSIEKGRGGHSVRPAATSPGLRRRLRRGSQIGSVTLAGERRGAGFSPRSLALEQEEKHGGTARNVGDGLHSGDSARRSRPRRAREGRGRGAARAKKSSAASTRPDAGRTKSKLASAPKRTSGSAAPSRSKSARRSSRRFRKRRSRGPATKPSRRRASPR